MNLGRKLTKAFAELLAASKEVDSAKTESSRKYAEHIREVARVRFDKAHKRVKRERRQKQLRDLGLM